MAIGAIISITACDKENSSILTCGSMGFVSGESQIITDEGQTFIITGGKEMPETEFGTRVYASVTLTECISEPEKIFNAKLLGFSIPACSVPVDCSSDNEETGWNDAISVADAWISGGYLNVNCSWIGRRDSRTEQKTALIYNGTSRDTVFFSLVHNSMKEGLYPDSADKQNLVIIRNKLATFPIQELIPGRNVTIKLMWKWHRIDGQYIHPETENHFACYSLADAAAASESAVPSTKAIISPLTTLLP